VRYLTVALIALLIATVVVLALALAATGDESDGAGRPIQVAPQDGPPHPSIDMNDPTPQPQRKDEPCVC